MAIDSMPCFQFFFHQTKTPPVDMLGHVVARKSGLFACHHASKADSTLSTSQPTPKTWYRIDTKFLGWHPSVGLGGKAWPATWLIPYWPSVTTRQGGWNWSISQSQSVAESSPWTSTGWWFGTMEFYDFPFSWEWNNHPNWRNPIFQRGRAQPLTRL